MASFTITITDTDDGENITLNVQADPPVVSDAPMTPAQQVGMHVLNSINQLIGGGDKENEH